MIRINLLPAHKRKLAGAGRAQTWGVVYFVAAVLWAGGLTAVHLGHARSLEEQQAANRVLREEIARTRADTADFESLEQQLKTSQQLEEVVARLELARTGPARVMRELGRILSADGGPTIDEAKLSDLREANPLAGYNPGWDVRRLWLTSFDESDRRCTLRGRAKSNEDVAEFLRRLSLSEVFSHVALERTNAVTDEASRMAVIEFTLTCLVDY